MARMGTLEETRGSQRQFLEKYLFGEAKLILPTIFYCVRTAKNFCMTVPFVYNFRSLFQINFLRFSEVLFLIFYFPGRLLFGELREA